MGTKIFFWKDKTGRGYTNTFTLSEILELDDEINYSGDNLHDWAENADEGDEFENSTEKYIRIQ